MARPEIGAVAGIPEGLKRLLAIETDKKSLIAVAKYLKANRNFIVLAWYTEQLLRRENDLILWLTHIQSLIELGFLSAADEVLDRIRKRVTSATNKSIAVDIVALEGRIAKQRLLDAPLPNSKSASRLASALKGYRAAHVLAAKDSSLRYYPGINIVGLLALAQRYGIRTPRGFVMEAWIESVDTDLKAAEKTENIRHWWQATKAECALAKGDVDEFGNWIGSLVNGKKSPNDIAVEIEALERLRMGGFFQTLPNIDPNNADAFVLASFHRQLTDIWAVDSVADPRISNVVMGLRQALLARNGGSLLLDRNTLATIYKQEAVLGSDGPLPISWVLQGLERAKSVAAIMMRDSFGEWRRIGTGFLIAVEGATSGYYALTNQHVVSDVSKGGNAGAAAHGVQEIQLRFEAVDPDRLVVPKRIVWESRPHDASLLHLEDVPEGAKPLEAGSKLPELRRDTRVYIIGHSGGEQLHMSLQDNELLDHEGEIENSHSAPVRLHYRAPTREGNSGSPVFAQQGWQLIALHRATFTRDGADTTLSGYQRYNRANEGISIASINQALAGSGSGISFRFT